MSATTQKKIDSFSLSIQPMTLADIPRLHQLSVAASWMHRREDWEFALKLGEGVFAVDEIGRVAGSAVLFPIAADFAALGMVIIAPRLVENGTDHWLVEQVLAQADGLGSEGIDLVAMDLVVGASTETYPAYVAHGFRAGRTIFQFQGVVSGAQPPADPRVRRLRAEDLPQLFAVDAAAYPVLRPRILDPLLALSSASVIEEDGKITGYALCRPFGRGQIIGPIVALNDADAIALALPHMAASAGAFIRVDTRETEGAFRDFLQAAGLKLHDTAITMYRGRDRRATGPQRIFGLVNHGIG